MHELDWSRTPLGARPSWPASLRSVVDLVLGIRLPMLLLWGPELVQIFNDAYVPLLGERYPRAMGQPTAECWPERWPGDAPTYARVRAGEVVYCEDQPCAGGGSSGGDTRWFTSCHSPVRDDAGAVAGILITLIDTTQRVLAESALRQTARADAYRIALADQLRALDDPIAIQAAAARALGTALAASRVHYAEVVDGGAWVVIEAEYRDGVASLVGRHRFDRHGAAVMGELRAGRTVVVPNVADEPQLTPAERATSAALGVGAYVLASLVKGGDPAALLVVQQTTPRAWTREDLGLIGETAERTHVAVERARAEAALRAAERRKDEFLATLAHELRNPLSPIRNGLQLIKLARGDQSRIDQAQRIMERQIDHLVRLVDDLLDVSRVRRGAIALTTRRLALATVVQHAIDAVRPVVERRRHALTLRTDPSPIEVEGDATRLVQVFSQLLDNAIKFASDGSWIRVSVAREGGEAVVRVRDDGIGIPAEHLGMVFEMFSHVDQSLGRSESGLGIGLALVKQLVLLHGGSVEAHSDGPGLGSEFVIRLPIAPSWSGARGSEPPAAATARRVLVVDDNRDAALSLAMLLDGMGHTTKIAHDGREAIAIAAAFGPDVILLDIGMPLLDGYEAARHMRQEPWGRHALVVALTGWGQDEDRRRSREAGFDVHLVKPVDPAELQRLLGERA